MNISEATDTVNLLRVMQGLRRMDGKPYHPDAIVEACEALAERAGKALNVTVPLSRSAVVQTLDHLAELDDDETPADDVEVVYVAPAGSTKRVEAAS